MPDPSGPDEVRAAAARADRDDGDGDELPCRRCRWSGRNRSSRRPADRPAPRHGWRPTGYRRRAVPPASTARRDNPRRKPRGETQRARRLDHQHGEVAATAVAEPQRLHRLLDALGFAPPVAKAVMDALREPGEKLESADRAAWRAGIDEPSGRPRPPDRDDGARCSGRGPASRRRYSRRESVWQPRRERDRQRPSGECSRLTTLSKQQLCRAAGKPRDRHMVAEGVPTKRRLLGSGLISRLASMTF